MRKIVGAGVLLLGACAHSPEQTLLTLCEDYKAAVDAVIPLVRAGIPTQDQVDAIGRSREIAKRNCDGTVTDFTGALAALEAELLRLAIIQRRSTED